MHLSLLVCLCLVALNFVSFFVRRYSKLKNVPGPLITSFTNLWRSYNQVFRGPFADVLLRLHEWYGPILRIGPNTVSVADASAVHTIYSQRGEFTKVRMIPPLRSNSCLISALTGFAQADSYHPLRSLGNGEVRGSILDMQDETKNSQLKRAVGGAFAEQNVLDFEQDIDVAITALVERLTHDRTVDLFDILQRFQVDFLMSAAFDENTHYLKNKEDVRHLSAQSRLQHWAKWQGSPALEHWIYKTPLLRRFYQSAKAPPWVKMALEKLEERRSSDKSPTKQDLLAKYMAGAEKHSEFLDEENLMRLISSTVSAGFDTTAFTMTTMLYYLTQSPSAMRTVIQEMEDAIEARDCVPPRYEMTAKLPYLDAVMREAMRCFPVVATPLERCVPEGGASVCGVWLPSGTSVGCSAAVVHQDRACFGQDASHFRPERWIDCDAPTRAAMERGSLGFGSGKRICLGRHLAEVEIKKTIPTLLLKFKVSLHSTCTYPVRLG